MRAVEFQRDGGDTSGAVTVAFEESGTRVVVEVDPAEAAGPVRRLFPALCVEPRPGEGPHFRVAGWGPGLRLGTEDGGTEEYDGLPGLLAALEFRLLERLLAPLGDWVHLHAAGALVQGRAVLAVGRSGAGKSSIALAWSRMGLPVLADDLILVGPGGRVRGFPRLAKVDRERLAEQGLSLEDTVAPVADHPQAWVDLHRDVPWPRATVPVALVAEVAYDGSGSRSSPLGPSALLQRLMANLLVTGLRGSEALDRLVPLAEEARGVTTRFDRAAEAARLLARTARGEAPPA